MKNLYEEYLLEIQNLVSLNKAVVIVYGSNVYGKNKSDLDVCIILDKDVVAASYIKKLIKITKKFHIKNNLSLDEEIPFYNKLVYSFIELENIIKRFPFSNKKNISRIIKSKEFLKSELMHKRLLINILTTDHRIITNSKELKDKILNCKKALEDLLLETMIRVYKLEKINTDSILQLLYFNPDEKIDGEDYLGYKNNYEEKEEYLKKWINQAILRRELNNDNKFSRK